MKLTPKLAFLFLILAIVPIAIVGSFSYSISKRTVERKTNDYLTVINQLKTNEVYRWIDSSRKSIEDLAQRPLVREYASVLMSHDETTAAYRQAHDRLVEDHLRPRLRLGGFISLSAICPVHAIILASDNPRQEGMYRDDRPYFLEGKSRSFVQGAYYSTSLEQPTIVVSTPVRDDRGELVGVLAGYLDLNELSKIIGASTQIFSSEDTYIVNKFNVFVTEPRFGRDYALKKAVHTEGVQAGLSGKDGFGYYEDYRGVPVIGAYKWMPEYQMCLLTELDQAEAYQPIIRLRKLIAGAALLIASAAALLAFLFARSITRPLRGLVAGTIDVGRGHFDTAFGTGQKDEVGELARAFDRMAARLKETTVSRDELAQRVRDRTAQLEAVNQELEAFAYSVSHDLRAPLRAMEGFSGALLAQYNDRLDDQGRHYLDRIQAAARRMGALISDILDLSRVTRREMTRARVNLSVMVNEILSELRAESPDRDLEWVVSEGTEAEGDPHLLRIALENLMKNAWKFTGAQERPRVEFGVEARADGRVFFVKDNGVGFDMAYASKLFAPFQRLHAMEEFPGTGIGLVTVKRIVTRHGGRVWTEAAVGQGATFFFTLGGNEDGKGNIIGGGQPG